MSNLADSEHGELLAQPGAVILVGERAARSLDCSPQCRALPHAPVPASAGCRGVPVTAVRSKPGLLPSLLPGGRPVADAAARVDTAAIWGVADGSRDTGARPSGDAAGGRAAGDSPLSSSRERSWTTCPKVPKRLCGPLTIWSCSTPTTTRSSSWRTWCSPSPPSRRRRAPSSTGRVASDDSRASHPQHAHARRTSARGVGCRARVDLALADAGAIRAQLAEFAGWEGARAESPDVPAPALEAAPGSLWPPGGR